MTIPICAASHRKINDTIFQYVEMEQIPFLLSFWEKITTNKYFDDSSEQNMFMILTLYIFIFVGSALFNATCFSKLEEIANFSW